MGLQEHKTIVFAEDMTDEQLEATLNCAKDAVALTVPNGSTPQQTFAEYMRHELDNEHGKVRRVSAQLRGR